MFDRRTTRGFDRRRMLVIAVGWLAAIGLMNLPPQQMAPFHSLTLGALRPALVPLASLRDRASQELEPWSRAAWTNRRELTERIDELTRHVQTLQHQRQQLEQRIAEAPLPHAPPENLPTLLETRVVAARVLGLQARSLLASRGVIAAPDGLDPGALVMDDITTQPWLDVGQDAQLSPGARVVASGRVWGQVHEVSSHVATVRRVTERGFRDLVEIRSSKEFHGTAVRGVLEGVGQGLCRIRFVETRFPLSVGDSVYAAERAALGRGTMLYGEIVRAESPPGASHWELWMRPSASGPWPESVGVCLTDLNPQRLAQQPSSQR